MNIEITGETEKLVQAALASGEGFGDANEYIQSLVREDQLTRSSLVDTLSSSSANLERQAIEGIESGAAKDIDDAFWQERRRHVTTPESNS